MSESNLGYFDPRLEQNIAIFRAKHRHWLELAQLVINASLELLGRLSLRRGGEHGDSEMVRGLYFIRSIHNCQAVLVLLQTGFGTQAEGVGRMHLEAVLRLKAIKEKPVALDRFIAAWNKDKSKKLRNLRQCIDDVADDVRQVLHSSEFEAIERELSDAAKGADEYKPWEIAKDANLSGLHKMAYVGMTDAIHSTLESLSEYIVEDSGGEIKQIRTDPSNETAGRTFISVIETQLVAMLCVADLCPNPDKTERQVNALNLEAKRILAITGFS